MKYYTSDLLQVQNNKTGKSTYWVKKCDVFQRVGKVDFDDRYQRADGLMCLVTRTTKTHVRHYSTVMYEVAA